MKDTILFVTKGGEHCDEGFSYVLELAKTLDASVEALIMRPIHLADNFEDIMAAATFAEADDMKTAKEIMECQQSNCREKLEGRIRELSNKAQIVSVDLLCHAADGDVAAAIKAILKEKAFIDMVLLSPSLSEKMNSLDIKRLLRNIAKPIVHISRPATALI
ncbi:MAG: hypothetical protein HZB31_05435 [Nitrospirae bacterium]|nr:hypothetical protein [Nitrospirota bacterium]